MNEYRQVLHLWIPPTANMQQFSDNSIKKSELHPIIIVATIINTAGGFEKGCS